MHLHLRLRLQLHFGSLKPKRGVSLPQFAGRLWGDPKVVLCQCCTGTVLPSPIPLTSGFFSNLQVWTIHPIDLLATRPKSPEPSINRPTSSSDNDPTGAPPYRLAEKIQSVCRHHSPHESLQNTSPPTRPCRVPLSILSRRPPLIHPHFRCGLVATVPITSNLPDHSCAVHLGCFQSRHS